MIQANELRIGNWVKQHDVTVYTSNILKPELIGQRIIEPKFNYCQIEYWHLEEMSPGNFSYYEYLPIPLTPEILEKCGFKFDKEPPYSTDQYGINSTYDESPFHCYWDGSKLTYQGWHISYLHSLQNLYFALTGTELDLAF